jgi:hypothetical protein
MLRRVLKRKEADRVLWVTLFLLTLLGVGVALKLSLNAEKRNRWVGGEPPDSELEANPLAAGDRGADSITPAPPAARKDSARAASRKADTVAAKPPPLAPQLVVQQLTTPFEPKLAAMTSACRNAIQERGTWRDDRAARPWPECEDADGNAMVVQLCTYARLASGDWVLTENSRNVPRCRAELPQVRAGKLRPVENR